MSHISEIETEIDSLSALKQACADLGWEFKENQTTYEWFGRWVGDTKPPAHLSPDELKDWIKSLGTCDHAIHIPGVNYEIGIRQRGNKYVLQYDYWDSKLKTAMGGQKGEKLVDAYNVARVEEEARRRGRRTEKVKLPNGKTLLRIHLPG